MHKTSNENQRGIAHVIAIVITVALIGAVGFVGFRAFTNKSIEERATDALASITAKQECLSEYDDEDLCKFLSSWNSNAKFKLESSSTGFGEDYTSTMIVDGDKSSYKMDGEYSMEVISIGDTTYTKAGDIWWKQTAEQTDEPDSVPSKDDYSFEEPSEDSEDVNLVTYEKIGEDACGDLNCYKYKVIDPSDSETTEFIWFDDKKFLIRKMVTETSEYKSESVFSYDNIAIEEPSPVKELGPNQYIIPGQAEPQTMPDVPQAPTEAELQEMIQQYAQ